MSQSSVDAYPNHWSAADLAYVDKYAFSHVLYIVMDSDVGQVTSPRSEHRQGMSCARTTFHISLNFIKYH